MRAQGALEYLIIIAAVLGISAVVVLFVTGAFVGSSGGADISKCRLAAANCQKDLTLGITTRCDYCIDACTDASGRDILDGKPGGGLACDQCKKGLPISAGAGTGIGVAGHWSMDDGRGILVSDGSGNSNTGTYFGETFNGGTLKNEPVWVTGMQGGAVLIDGLNDYVLVNSVPSLKYAGGNITLMAWIRANSTEANGGYIFSKPWNGNGQYNYQVQFTGDERIIFNLLGGDVSAPYGYSSISSSANSVPKTEWHHVAVTANSSNSMKLYIDGQERASGTWSQPSWTPSRGDENVPLAIGTLYPYPTWPTGNDVYSFNGTIDSARFWTKALNQTEIQAEMASSRPVIKPLADWEFEENSGPFANDTHIWVAGRPGNAIGFDGINDYMMVPDSASLVFSNLSISAWIKWDGLRYPSTRDWASIISKGSFSGGEFTILMTRSQGGTTNFFNFYVNSAARVGWTTTLDTNWHHIATTYNGSKAIIYFDGIERTSADSITTIPDTTHSLAIGHQSSGNSPTSNYNWGGAIDQVRVYNRILSPAEISSFYTNP